MDRKIKVQICVGTACHIMGAADLITIEDLIPEALRDRVKVTGLTCLGACRDEVNGKPPFVIIDGETISQATLDKVLRAIERRAERLFDRDSEDAGS